jgi:hypothetical protein
MRAQSTLVIHHHHPIEQPAPALPFFSFFFSFGRLSFWIDKERTNTIPAPADPRPAPIPRHIKANETHYSPAPETNRPTNKEFFFILRKPSWPHETYRLLLAAAALLVPHSLYFGLLFLLIFAASVVLEHQTIGNSFVFLFDCGLLLLSDFKATSQLPNDSQRWRGLKTTDDAVSFFFFFYFFLLRLFWLLCVGWKYYHHILGYFFPYWLNSFSGSADEQQRCPSFLNIYARSFNYR